MDWTLIAIAFLGGGGLVTAVVMHWLNRRNQKIDNEGKEVDNAASHAKLSISRTDALRDLEAKINAMMIEKFDMYQKLQSETMARINAEMMVKLKDSQLDSIHQDLKEFLIEQGRSSQREQQCQQELAEIKSRLNMYESLAQVQG